jgi:DnaJ-class molecular chaperone
MSKNNADISSESNRLEEVCGYCNGAGGETVEGSGRWQQCAMCNGAGYIPNEFGEAVVALMRHNFRSMLNEAMG